MKTRHCTFCNTKLKFNATVCPTCNHKQPRTAFFLKHISLLALIICLMVWMVIFPSLSKPSKEVPESISKLFKSNENSSLTSSVKLQPPAATEKPTPSLDIFLQKAERVSQKSIEMGIESDPDFYSSSNNSNNFIKLSIKMRNNSPSEIKYAYDDFRLKSSKGLISQSYSEFYKYKNFINSGVIDSKGEFEGVLFFMDLQPSENYVLQYRTAYALFDTSKYKDFPFSLKNQINKSDSNNTKKTSR